MIVEYEKIEGATPLNRYQFLAGRTALKIAGGLELVERTLGLAEEIAELHVQLRKIGEVRRMPGVPRSEEQKAEDAKLSDDLIKEAGDVLWYCSQVASDLGLELGGAMRKVLVRSGLDQDASWLMCFPVGHEFLVQDVAGISVYLRMGNGLKWQTPPKPDGLPDGPQAARANRTQQNECEWAMSQIILHGGMVCGLVKKAYRDCGGVMDQERAGRTLMHLGFILTSLSTVVSMSTLGAGTIDSVGLSHVADINIKKLADRAARNAIKGDGDHR
jgi:NTP pyrophosphatase (non-canonical NTP hydrolase)